MSRTGPDRCPGVLALHQAADGWLARVRLPGGRLTASQLQALADVANLGNDLVELTARTNIQIRGLEEGAGEDVATHLRPAGLLPSLTHERARNVLASPIAGRHPRALLDVDGIVSQLDRELCADRTLSELPGRFLFLVEDGSGVLDGYDHDLALVPGALSDERPHGGGPGLPRDAELALLVAGVDSGWRALARDAPALAIVAARAFLSIREGAWRVSELPGGPRELIDALGPVAAERHEAVLTWGRAPGGGLAAGRTVQCDGRVALTALVPLGRLNASQLRALAEISAEVRVSPWRTLSLVDLPDAAVAAELIRIGLILDPDSGWAGLSACAGLGACRSAQVDVRAAAAARATTRGSGAPPEHWSACTRRCGELRGTPVTIAADGGRLLLRTPADREERIVPEVDAALALLREPSR